MLDESRNIWHEAAMLSLAVEKPIVRVRDAAALESEIAS